MIIDIVYYIILHHTMPLNNSHLFSIISPYQATFSEVGHLFLRGSNISLQTYEEGFYCRILGNLGQVKGQGIHFYTVSQNGTSDI